MFVKYTSVLKFSFETEREAMRACCGRTGSHDGYGLWWKRVPLPVDEDEDEHEDEDEEEREAWEPPAVLNTIPCLPPLKGGYTI